MFIHSRPRIYTELLLLPTKPTIYNRALMKPPSPVGGVMGGGREELVQGGRDTDTVGDNGLQTM